MSDKTVPTDADDYKQQRPADESQQDREAEMDELVENAISHWGEPPNRDEDEFTSDGLKTPDVETDLPEAQDESK